MEQNSQIKKLQYIIVSCMFAFAVLLVVSIFSIVSYSRARKANANYNEFIASLEKKEENLKNSIANRSDEAYLEEQARNHLGMIKDGETLYIFK